MNKVSIYDPFRNAYCQVPIDHAKKLLACVEDIKKSIAEAEKKISDQKILDQAKGVKNEQSK